MTITEIEAKISLLQNELVDLKNQALALEQLEELKKRNATIEIDYYDEDISKKIDMRFQVQRSGFARIKMTDGQSKELHEFLVSFVSKCLDQQ